MNLNERSDDHFPILAVSYGYLALIQPYLLIPEKYYETLPSEIVGDSVAANLYVAPGNTYLYDSLTTSEADDMLDDVNFYNQVNKGIRLGNFFTT